MTNSQLLKMAGNDQIAIALASLEPGQSLLPVAEATAIDAVPAGHKIALQPIAAGETVRRFDQPIGVAGRAIAAGEHVHTHNLTYPGSLAAHTVRVRPPAERLPGPTPTFLGYRRPDGRVGTRNYIGVLTTVNCSARVARLIAAHFAAADALAAFPWIDGVVPLTHGSGCSVSDGSPSMDMLRRTIAGYTRHPNFVGVLIVGLGCEDNQIDMLCKQQGLNLGLATRSLTIQDLGGTSSSVAAGIEVVTELMREARATRRVPVPASELSVGLQCGGSDSFSGLTANPALGAAMDLLVGHGGTAILSETPEIYGAENLLLQRVASADIGNRLISLLEWWERYTAHEPKGFDNNPTPGNKAGGLTTILEKSLGAVAKGGSTTLMEVYPYGEQVTTKGLVFMDSPGFDPMSATGQVAGGANLICFTTGRGSCFGCRPAPSLKLATNTDMFRRMQEDMDINCGMITDGTATIETMGQIIFDEMLSTASGKATKSEILGYGDDEFVPWHINAWV